MLHRTIFIGLGSTGCNTLDALQDIAYLSTGDAEMGGAWAYLKLDTAAPGDKTFCGDTSHSIQIQVSNNEINTLEEYMKNLDLQRDVGSEDLSWLWKDGRLRIKAQTAGSGMNRRYARSCIYYYWEVEQKSSASIKKWLKTQKTEFIEAEGKRSPQAIEAKLRSILPQRSIVPKVSNSNVRYVIVAALGGGTGSGALLELAKRMEKDEITHENILCLSYPPSVDHPSANDTDGNNRRGNAMESLSYYELYLQDQQSKQLLRPHLIISPSNDQYTLAADDSQAMRQLEYMGAMFLSRISAALEFDAIAVDLLKDADTALPHAWTFAFTGVRIPALELKAMAIYNAVDRVCNPANSSDPINWFSDPQVHWKTIEQQAKDLVKASFNHIYRTVENRLSSVSEIRKRDFSRSFIDNQYDWFGTNEDLLKKVINTIVEQARNVLKDKVEIQSINYIRKLLAKISELVKEVPQLNEASVDRAYKMLKGDPPSHEARNRLFAWYMLSVLGEAVREIENKLDFFQDALRQVRISPEAVDMIKRRQDANFYYNIIPDNFDIKIPRFSFLELDSVNNLFDNLNEKIDPSALKQDILRKILRIAEIPAGTQFDRTQFTTQDAKDFMKDKIQWPMLNLTDRFGIKMIVSTCFGGALTEILGDRNRSLRDEFNKSINDLELNVETDRIDSDLARLMSPLQLDALKIWKDCSKDKLKIGQKEFRDGATHALDPETQADYYPLEGMQKQTLAMEVLKRLLICTDNERKDDSHVSFIYELPQYKPTSWSSDGYGLVLRYNTESSQKIDFPEDDNLSSLFKRIMDVCRKEGGEAFLNNWVRFVNAKLLEDNEYKQRWDNLFAEGDLNLILPDGKPTLIYSSHRP